MTVIGGANIDIHGKSSGPLRASDSNPGTVHVSAGGVGRNIAENLARLGTDCRLISVVGDDDHGRLLMRLSREAGVDVSNVHIIDSAPTSTYLAVIDETGEMKVAVNDMSIADQLTPGVLQQHEAMLLQSSLLVLDTNLPEDSIAWITSEFADKPIFVDTVSAVKAPRIRKHLGAVHTLKTNAVEAEALTGLEARTMQQLAKTAEQLHAAGVASVFVTRGSEGVFYSTREKKGSMAPGAEKPAVRNTTGAGDAFLAGLVHAHLENWNLGESLQFALTRAREKIS